MNFVDRYSSVLGSGYTSGGTTLSVSSASGLPTGTCYFYVIVKAEGSNTEEVFLVTSISGTTLTVTGAQAGTSASNHAAGAVIVGSILTADISKKMTYDLFNDSDRLKAGGTYVTENHAPTYSGGTPTANWTHGTDFTILSYSGGPGYVANIWMAIAGYTTLLDSATITITVDGVADISGVNMEMFFLRNRAGQSSDPNLIKSNVKSRYFSWSQEGTFQFFLPIPFTSSISIVVHSGESSTDTKIWSQVDYITGVPNQWPYAQKLKVAISTGTSFSSVGQVITMLDVTPNKKGRLFGVYMCPDGLNSISPAFAFLEGFVKMYRDGSGSPFMTTTGTEDYFLDSGYFAGTVSPNISDYVGLTYKNNWAIYAHRFHIPDPILFNTGLKITWDAGESSRISFTGTGSIAYCIWYYIEN